MSSSTDAQHLSRAAALACKAMARCSPNPARKLRLWRGGKTCSTKRRRDRRRHRRHRRRLFVQCTGEIGDRAAHAAAVKDLGPIDTW